MPDRQFLKKLCENDIDAGSVIDISNDGKILIMSDLHMGHGSRDDFNKNGNMVAAILEEYYFKKGWTLILNGDIEELQKYSLDDIKKKWKDIYRIFDLFNSENRLYKIIGNHDELLNLINPDSYPYYNHQFVKINTGTAPAYVFHGHQLSKLYSKLNKIFGLGIRYILKPLGIMNISDSRNPYKKFDIEKKAYAFGMENNCLSIIGHTHRALFESLSSFDFIKFEIENLCRIYPEKEGDEREKIEKEVTNLRQELDKLKRKEKRDIYRQSLYGDELPVPCLFNSGCTLGNKGINAIELTKEKISLIYWFTEGKCKKFIQRGGYEIENMSGTAYNKVVLNQDRLDYISAKIKLLGN